MNNIQKEETTTVSFCVSKARFSFMCLVLFGAIFAGQWSLYSAYLPVEGYPEIQVDLINGKEMPYYFKYPMGKDRTAYIDQTNKVIVMSDSSGRVATLNGDYMINTLSEENQHFLNMKVKLSRSKVEYEYDINKYYFQGEGEVKTKSAQKGVVGKVKLVYNFSSSGIKYEMNSKALKAYSMRGGMRVVIEKIQKTEDEKDARLFKKNRRKSTIKFTPLNGFKPFELKVFDDAQAFKEKLKLVKGKKKGFVGYAKIEVNRRLGCSRITHSLKSGKDDVLGVYMHDYSYISYGKQYLDHIKKYDSKLSESFYYKGKNNKKTHGYSFKLNAPIKIVGELKIK
jgi:hypothetical protein